MRTTKRRALPRRTGRESTSDFQRMIAPSEISGIDHIGRIGKAVNRSCGSDGSPRIRSVLRRCSRWARSGHCRMHASPIELGCFHHGQRSSAIRRRRSHGTCRYPAAYCAAGAPRHPAAGPSRNPISSWKSSSTRDVAKTGDQNGKGPTRPVLDRGIATVQDGPTGTILARQRHRPDDFRSPRDHPGPAGRRRAVRGPDEFAKGGRGQVSIALTGTRPSSRRKEISA